MFDRLRARNIILTFHVADDAPIGSSFETKACAYRGKSEEPRHSSAKP